MTNALTFIKHTESVTTNSLDNLAAELNASAMDISYYFFVLTAIAERHHDLKMRIEAERYLAKQEEIQDEFDYLNICIEFLKRQVKKVPGYSTLNQAELLERKASLTNDISIFIKLNKDIEKACIRFTDEYFQTGNELHFIAA